MKGQNIIDIVERSQTRHALQEERALENFRASTNGALTSDVPEKNAKPTNDQEFQQKEIERKEN